MEPMLMLNKGQLRRKNTFRLRQNGASLTELLIATVLIGVSIAALGEMTGLSTKFATRFLNRTNAIDSAKVALGRIAVDVRAAKAFGDFYGGYATNLFPSDDNPFYKVAIPPPSGWPSSWSTSFDPAPPYSLNGRYLILQQPILYLDKKNDPGTPAYSSGSPQNSLNGFPIMYKPGDTMENNPPFNATTTNIQNLDTVIYAIVPDTLKPGEYQLQMARFPGAAITSLPIAVPPSSYRSAINPPQVVVSGIIGPLGLDPSGPPEIFSYYAKSSSGKLVTILGKDINASNAASVIGVKVDMEFKKPDSANNASETYSQYYGVHNEVFLRSNKNLVLRNYY
jgi:hypothetical protein